MKSLFFILTALLAFNASAATCQEKAEAAAMKKANPNPESSLVYWEIDTESTELVSQKGKKLQYKVTVMSGYADYTESGEFPDEYYDVYATGTEASCRVTKVELIGSESL